MYLLPLMSLKAYGGSLFALATKPTHYDMQQRVRKLAKTLDRPLVSSDLTDEERGLIEAARERWEEEVRNGRPPDGYPVEVCSGFPNPTQRL